MLGLLAILGGSLLGVVLVVFFLSGFCTIGPNDVGILTKRMLGRGMPPGQIIARNGQVGIQAKILMPGLYWRIPIIWKFSKVKVIEIDTGKVGVVETIDGEPLDKGRILGNEVECNQFQDAEAFLKNHGRKGPQVAILRPGSYRINTFMFKIGMADVTSIPERSIGIVVAKDGIPLPSGYIVAPQAKSASGEMIDHKFFQNGQGFLDGNGYRGPQLDTLQPGKYYINPLLFTVKQESVAEVAPGFVAIIRSNVGLELEKPSEGPKVSTGEGKLGGPIHEDVERLLISNKYTRGIWKDPIAPGQYNLNTLAFTPYLVPTSAITIDWASEGRISSETTAGMDPYPTEDKQRSKKRLPDIRLNTYTDKESSVLYQFDPLKVTSMDGFLLEVNVRMVIRIQPANAAYIIARFGSVVNLIDQIVHPLIDASFRNKAGEKKAIDFFQSRTKLQEEALAHAKAVFSEYNVEAQNLLIAYIVIPDNLLDTQTRKEIANQQKSQYDAEAEAQDKRIAVMEKSARAEKQKDVIDAKLSIDISQDMAQATIKRAEGEQKAIMLVAEGNAYKSEKEGEGIAQAYEKQKEAIGQTNVAMIRLIQEIAAGKIQIVPQIVAGGSNGSLLDVLIAQLVGDKQETPKKK